MRSVWLAIAVVMPLMSAGCQPAGGCAPLSEKDIAAIKKTEQDYIQNFLAGDWEGVAALFAEDAVVMGPDRPLERGRTILLAHLAAIDRVTDFTVTESEIHGTGGLAYFRWAYTVTAFAGGSPNPITYTGKGIDVLRKQPDGRWLIVLESYSRDHPLTTLSADAET